MVKEELGVDRQNKNEKRWGYIKRCRVCIVTNNRWNNKGDGRNRRVQNDRQETTRKNKEFQGIKANIRKN